MNWQTFRFPTRIQKLNSMEASARSVNNFLDSLERFHDQRHFVDPSSLDDGSDNFSTPPPKPHTFKRDPIVEGRVLNLYSLREHVRELGGYEKVRPIEMRAREPKFIYDLDFLIARL